MAIEDFEVRGQTIRYAGVDVADIRRNTINSLVEKLACDLNGTEDRDKYKEGYNEGHEEGHDAGRSDGIGDCVRLVEGFNSHDLIEEFIEKKKLKLSKKNMERVTNFLDEFAYELKKKLAWEIDE